MTKHLPMWHEKLKVEWRTHTTEFHCKRFNATYQMRVAKLSLKQQSIYIKANVCLSVCMFKINSLTP
jgi:hypothetical protein